MARMKRIKIKVVENLDVRDFICRFVILKTYEADLISVLEAAMIRQYAPLWNSCIDGFGNHDPGKGRHGQAKSEWDVLHPGRAWAYRLNGSPPDVNKILDKIGIYYDRKTL